MRSEQTRQTKRSLPQRQKLASYNKNTKSQNPTNTQSYQTIQMQNEIFLPYFLQQHKVTKTQITNFSQILKAAESQQTLNPYLLSGSFISSN